MKRSQFIILTTLLITLIAVVFFNSVDASSIMGNGAPAVVSYQGKVTQDGSLYTGSGYFKFAVVNLAGDISFWSNDGSSSAGGEPSDGVQLMVANGLFHVLLGDTNLTHMNALSAAVFNDTERYLRIWFSTDGSTYSMLSPDMRIAAVPYALQAQEAVSAADADLLDGLDSTSFATSIHDHDSDYLGIGAQAADSDLLDGLNSTEFATTTHDHDSDYLGINGTAADSAMLDGDPASSYFGGSYVADAWGLPLLGAECLHQGGSLLVVARDGSPYCSTPGGTGVFTDTEQRLGNSPSFNVALGDLDSDGDLDAFVTNYTFDPTKPNRVWLNDGTGIFDPGQELIRGNSEEVALGDVDGDGDLDAYVANSSPNKVWLNDGDGFFTDSGQSLDGATNRGIALGDLDGDGDLDAFITTFGSANHVRINDGAGTFADSGQSLGGGYSQGIALGDVDGDGDLDAFVANAGGSANKVWLNDGDANYSDSGQSLGGSTSYEVYLADLDSDSDLDAYVINSGTNRLWTNDGTGTFTDSGQALGSRNSYGGALGDLDGDGDLDAYIANDGADRIWINDGSGIFTETLQAIGSTITHGVALGDMDGDGDLDAFLAKDSSRANQVWENIDASFLPQDGTAVNSDLLNGYAANQLVRAAYASSGNLDDIGVGVVLETEITAPVPGLLIMSSSMDADNSHIFIPACEILINGVRGPNSFRYSNNFSYEFGGIYSIKPSCNTNSVLPVSPGTYTIGLKVSNADGYQFLRGTIWVLFVPFDGSGNTIVPP